MTELLGHKRQGWPVPCVKDFLRAMVISPAGVASTVLVLLAASRRLQGHGWMLFRQWTIPVPASGLSPRACH